MKDTEILKLFEIPISTLQDWKKGKSGKGKLKLYKFLKSFEMEQVKERFRILGIENSNLNP